jgi:hypothetical protein
MVYNNAKMLSMATHKQGKLNQLQELLPEGLLADAALLARRGYSTSLRSQYVSSGWLEQPVRGVYLRPHTKLSWQQAVVSLQTILQQHNPALIVGGRTALELQGYAHYLPQVDREVFLYGDKPPPSWLMKLPLEVTFVFRNDGRLFRNDPVTKGTNSVMWKDWPLTLSTPERAVLQLLDELPSNESFEQADKLFEGLTNLSPHKLQKLLVDCRSVKVKRLFFFFADRHNHSWVKHLNKNHIDLGSGKRVLVKGGRFDPKYKVTLPGELFDGIR